MRCKMSVYHLDHVTFVRTVLPSRFVELLKDPVEVPAIHGRNISMGETQHTRGFASDQAFFSYGFPTTRHEI